MSYRVEITKNGKGLVGLVWYICEDLYTIGNELSKRRTAWEDARK